MYEEEIAKQKVVDESDWCQYKFEALLISFSIESLETIEDVRSKMEKMSEYIAEYKFLIKKINSIGIQDDEVYQIKLEKMVEFVNEGNEKMKSIRNLESSQIEKEKVKEKDEKVKNIFLNQLIARACKFACMLVTCTQHARKVSCAYPKFSCTQLNIQLLSPFY